MQFWNFSTAAHTEADRVERWRRALDNRSLASGEIADHSRFFGIAAAIETPQQTEYVYLSSRSQQIEFPGLPNDRAMLMLLIEGRGAINQKGKSATPLMSGDFAFGAPRSASILTMDEDFRALIIRLPREILAQRLVAPVPDALQLISGDSSFAAIFADLLTSVSAKLGALTFEQFHSLELALIEFVGTAILSEGDTTMLGGVTGRRAGVLQRVARSIEQRLGEPDLKLSDIAAANGMSVRNLQKLFEAFGKAFSVYVRSRRLERCRDDLASPLMTQLSISEICYRWGFTDPAYFSRSFREQFGASPRGFRRAPHLYQTPAREGPTLRRGRPKGPELSDTALSMPSDGLGDFLHASEEADDLDAAGREPREHYLPVSPETVHWGFFHRNLAPVLKVRSGDFVTIECLTHHAYDDYERMIAGDPAAEAIFEWTTEGQRIERRGAGPMDASICGRGPGEGFGVHICTGPIAVEGARPGDILEVRIHSVEPRRSANPDFLGQTFGSNLAAYWGFHHQHLLTEPRDREVVTIYKVDCEDGPATAQAVYNYRWTPQTDPSGIIHDRYDYPGVPVDHSTIEKIENILPGIKIPVRPHFGVIAVAPDHDGQVDSIPPSSHGGNMDNWRLGEGASVYLPVAVPNALFSVGDPHASQGDGETCGTAIECSLTGRFELILHKRSQLAGTPLTDVNYPLIETNDEWVIPGFSHPDYLGELGQDAQSDIYHKSSIDFAMRDAFRKVRRFLISARSLSEDEALSLISVAVDFGISQVANGNCGVHAIVRKAMFDDADIAVEAAAPVSSATAP
ncbi:transcriptional regulator [Novosphingobium endophyticum]|uniref:Transcriptional regulator n=1 Tax=Novosphingobium endophyticum TaxID=1955250 RepID=A0A916TWH6_9SPHN|nr:acetamidase/formamidase family protein [Novosphingobium endophyticum]GGC15636.1 transcriptional regulator [Novosphingobium endophyticum]